MIGVPQKFLRLIALVIANMVAFSAAESAAFAQGDQVEPGCYQLAIARGQADIATNQASCDRAYQIIQDDWCSHATSPSNLAVCRDPELRELAFERNKAYYDAQARLDVAANPALFNDQTAWGSSYARACGITSNISLPSPLPPQIKDCMLRAGRARLSYLRDYNGATANQQAAAAPQQAAPAPVVRPPLPFRLSDTDMTECARYWHRQCVPPPSAAAEDECLRYWYRQQVNARPQSVENDCRDEEGVIRAQEFAALSQRRNEEEQLFKRQYAPIEALSAQGYTAQAADMMRDWSNRYQLWALSLSAEIDAAADRAQRIVDQHACARGDRSKCRW